MPPPTTSSVAPIFCRKMGEDANVEFDVCNAEEVGVRLRPVCAMEGAMLGDGVGTTKPS